MKSRSWLKSLCHRLFGNTVRKPIRRTSRLQLESLEDRSVPAQFLVTSAFDDNSDGTFRWAIQQANETAGADQIVFDTANLFSSPQSILLSQGQLTISDDLEIVGSGKDQLALSGYFDEVTQQGNTIIVTTPGTTLAISGLTIENANAWGYGPLGDYYELDGGGINNAGNLTVTDCLFSSNYGNGGGIFNSGTLTINNSDFSNNSYQAIINTGTLTVRNASFLENYIGIENDGILTIDDSTFSNNWDTALSNFGTMTVRNSNFSGNGTGIYSDGSSATIINCTFSTNLWGAINNAGSLEVENSTFSDNKGSSGGAINNAGNLEVSNCTFSNNSQDPFLDDFRFGGAIYNYGSLEVENSTFSDNQAANGGAIYNTGSLTIHGTTFSNNRSDFNDAAYSDLGFGGAIYNSGSLIVDQSSFTGNSTILRDGGAIYNTGSSNIANSTFSGNSTARNGGAIGNGFYRDWNLGTFINGNLFLTGCTFSNNIAQQSGGGIYSENASLTIDRSTFVQNSAFRGGGIRYSRSYIHQVGLIISNSTFAENSATGVGGGIEIWDQSELEQRHAPAPGLILINDTIANNSAGVAGGLGYVQLNGPRPLEVGNTIIAKNVATGGNLILSDASGGYKSKGHNLIGIGPVVVPVAGDLYGTADSPLDPLLAPLGYYGGQTQTMPLLPGSPALDAGNNALAVDSLGNPLTTDQRGIGFDRIIDGTVDIGAFENHSPDNDGVSDAVEDSAPNGGDGNDDGTLDSQQVNVTSLPNPIDNQYLTLESSTNPTLTTLADVTASPVPSDLPASVKLPMGVIEFTVQGLAPGGATTVILYLPDDTKINKYFKFGLEPTDNPLTPLNEHTTPHWWDFSYDGITGAEIFAGQDPDSDPEMVILHFVDGLRGDNDGIPNGMIVDPGAPVLVIHQVQIDIKPGSNTNSTNLTSQGLLAVAILSTAEFDATTVDISSVRFAGASAVNYSWEDVDQDGDLDLVLHFRIQDTNLRSVYEQLLADDINADGILDSNHQEVAVSLTGNTHEEELIEGTDTMDLFLSGKALRDLLANLAANGLL